VKRIRKTETLKGGVGSCEKPEREGSRNPISDDWESPYLFPAETLREQVGEDVNEAHLLLAKCLRSHSLLGELRQWRLDTCPNSDRLGIYPRSLAKGC
jgi:hypothetical protein